ncbi:uncharacterized protein LOC134207616 [Armigeres subalbatus]|uniref:uncharacterized protein LOC134207616 n=1 Tax=Armigeres subalbatus TaxID=124917 RepID=UPI002ED00981
MDSTASLRRLTSIQISAETTVYTSLDSSIAALQKPQQRREDQVDGARSLPPAVELLLSAAASVPATSVYISAAEPTAGKLVLQRERSDSEKEERVELLPSRSSVADAVALGKTSTGSSLLETVREKPSSPCSPSSPVISDQQSHVVRIQIVQTQSECSSPINSVVNHSCGSALISVTNNSSSATIVNGSNQCKSKVSIVSFGPPDLGSKSPSPTPSIEMVQKHSSPSASPTSGAKSDLVDATNATYLYYMMSSGQCSPSDTLDSGTCSDIEVTPPPLPKKMVPKSPSPTKHPAAQHAKLMMISPTPSDKLNQPNVGFRSNYTTSDSDESESSLSCDSLNFSQLCGNVSALALVDSISGVTTIPQTPEPLSSAVTPTSDSDRENVIPECPQLPPIMPMKHKIVSILPDSLQGHPRTFVHGSAAREVPSPSPPHEETPVVGMTTTRSILMEKINSLNSVAAGGSVSSLSEKNKSISFENDKFYKFHINEHSNLQQQQQQTPPNQHDSRNGSVHLNNNHNHSCSSSVIDDDESFAGFKDLTSGTSTIRSNKGTVRGVKNRVRNGIATFLQMQQANIKNYKEKDAGKVVVYTTSMGIVRETYTKCANVKQILRTLLVKFEERDVFMSSDYQQEIKDRMQSEAIQVPQVFVDGQHVGDADCIERLNESGELRKMLKPYKCLESSFTCKTCGGYRLLPCPSCGGSKKSIHRNHFTAEFIALKCMNCDEVGLVKCHNC